MSLSEVVTQKYFKRSGCLLRFFCVEVTCTTRTDLIFSSIILFQQKLPNIIFSSFFGYPTFCVFVWITFHKYGSLGASPCGAMQQCVCFFSFIFFPLQICICHSLKWLFVFALSQVAGRNCALRLSVPLLNCDALHCTFANHQIVSWITKLINFS